MSRLFALVGVLFLVLPCPAVAQTAANTDVQLQILSEKETLRGIQAVTVEVMGVDALKAFLAADTLKTNIELKLRQNGFTVKQLGDDQGRAALLPTVGLQGNILKLEHVDSYVYSLSLRFIRTLQVPFMDDKKVTLVMATTWNQDIVGIVPASEVDRVIRQTADDLVSRFLNDYLEQNPKR